MPTRTRAAALLLCLFATASLAAQPPRGRRGPGMMPGGFGRGGASPIGATADFLLAHTGDLALTDAQVVRLAAISRRTDARRKAMIARMDSARAAAPAPGDSVRPRGRGPRAGAPPSAELERAREQMHAEVRDAIAVLTPDQQATAWLMIAGGPALGATPGRPMRPRPGRPDESDQRNDRGSIGRPPAARDVPRRPDGAERVEP